MLSPTLWIILLLTALSGCAELDQSLRLLSPPQSTALTHEKIAAGLKEALRIGTDHATTLTGKPDGYFRNAAIKILMPDQLHAFEKGLRVFGFGPQVDEFVLSMNRAAERAAPQAKNIFLGAIAQMTFADAQQILSGGETAATDYFRSKTTAELTAAFRPQVEQAMNEVGVTRQYKDLVQQDSDFALNLGVQSTPTFFINGLALVGAQPLSAFTQIIDKELAGEIPK